MKLTRRGRRVRAIVLILLALYATIQVSANLWYVDGRGYCWGSYEKCYPMEGEGK
jgi:hypothetical protein